MTEKSVCFTGHRDIKKYEEESIKHRLQATITSLIKRGYVYFLTGGALGFDTLAAETVLEAKKAAPKAKLILILPHKKQADSWSAEDRAKYEYILSRADMVSYTSESYFKGCMQMRNRALVDSSSICVCRLSKNSGGTFYTVGYAQKKGLEIIRI